MELLKLIECEVDDWLADNGRSVRVYEVYVGDFVKVIGDSANGYWHDRIEYEASDYPKRSAVVDEATVAVISDGGYVGHWKSVTLFYDFLRIYMRANNFMEVVA